ncbi:MAG: sigma-70 family RNA polymerase sigma factor [Bauldia litoralis]
MARDRDRSAFAGLFNHFAPRLKSFMRRGGASDDLAEDIVQEAMVQVWRKAHLFDPDRAAVSTWVFKIARNKRIDRLRSENRPSIDEDNYRADQPGDPGPLEEAAQEQAAVTMRDLVATLPREQMQVIEKAFFEDKPHSEIAEELDLPLGTVKSRIRRALARLKSDLPDDEL